MQELEQQRYNLEIENLFVKQKLEEKMREYNKIF